MGFLTGLLGGETSIWTILLALAIVIVLIFIGVWILKLIFKASVTIAGGRKRRLAIVDSLAIDNKRNIILLRRDDVEHLIMVSSSGDLLIEAAIPADPATGSISRTSSIPQRPMAKSATSPRIRNGDKNAGMAAVASAMAQNQNASGDQTPEQEPEQAPNRENSLGRLGLSRLLSRDQDKTPLPGTEQDETRANRTEPLVSKAPLPSVPVSTPDARPAPPTGGDRAGSPGPAPILPRATGILKPVTSMVSASNDTLADLEKNTNGQPKTSSNDNSDKELSDEGPGDNGPAENGSGRNQDDPGRNKPVKDTPEKSVSAAETAQDTSESQPATGHETPSPASPGTQKTEEFSADLQDNVNALSPDSAKNETRQIDTRAMESIEEGADSGNDGARSSKRGQREPGRNGSGSGDGSDTGSKP